jgi:hypothetical protein
LDTKTSKHATWQAPLNLALAGTGRAVFVYSLLFFAALVMERLFL